MFVFAWGGQDFARKDMHPPFNLMLRLLVELRSGIIFPVSQAAAKELDKESVPFQSGNDEKATLTVSKQTATETQI